MKLLFRALFLLLFTCSFLNAPAEHNDIFEPKMVYRESSVPGFKNVYCDTSVVTLYSPNDYEVDTIHYEFHLDRDFPATDDAEFNSNLMRLIDSARGIVDHDLESYDYYNKHLYLADSIVVKVTSYNDSIITMVVRESIMRPNFEVWRTRKDETLNFSKKTKSRFYKDIKDSISMWFSPKNIYVDHGYDLSDYLITIFNYTEASWGSGAGGGSFSNPTIIDRKKWEPIGDFIWSDSWDSLWNFLVWVEISKDFGYEADKSAKNQRYDICSPQRGYNKEESWSQTPIGADENGLTLYIERIPGMGWQEQRFRFEYDQIYDFLMPGTAVHHAAQKYCETHKPIEFEKKYLNDSIVDSWYIGFNDMFITTGDTCGYRIPIPCQLLKSKELSDTWSWVNPQYHENRDVERGEEITIPKEIKYEGFHRVSEKGDAEITVRVFTNLVKDYPESIPTLTASPTCEHPDFHEYDLPNEKLSKQFIFRYIDEETKYMIEYDLRCLPERAYYYQVASYMMFNCFNSEEYNRHYEYTHGIPGK